MTAAQKIAKEKFKKAIAYRQKTGVSLKEAFAHIYGKKTVKKKAVKKPTKYKSKLTNKYKTIKSTDNIEELKKYGYQLKGVTKKTAKKVGAVKRKAAKKKPSEQSILNKIHRVKDEVNKLDEAQHKHMSGISNNTIKQIQNNLDQLVHLERKKLIYEDWKKEVKNVADKKRLNQMLKSVKDLIKEHKTHIIQLKKHIK